MTGDGLLMAVPNVSEGHRAEVVEAIGGAFASSPGVRLLDVHSDPDHNRSVFTLAGPPGALAPALLAGAHATVEHIDLRDHDGVHPHVGALDVAPVVHVDSRRRGAACAEALVAGDLLARELDLPVFLYGALAGGRTRAQLRAGGLGALAQRVLEGSLAPDFGPRRVGASHGAVLLAARPPLIAFNVDLEPGVTVEQARAVAAEIREGGPAGLPGLRAIGLALAHAGHAQVSTNIEDHERTTPADVVAAVAARLPVRRAELVGLAPRAAFADFPSDVELAGLALIEDRLAGES